MSQQSVEGGPYQAGQTVGGRYEVRDAVGDGPLGFVYKAHDKEIDVDVALKVINPRLLQTVDERKQFSQVLRAGRKIAHPNVVRIYEDGEDHDRPFFTMQFLEGLTLRKIIDLRVGKGQFFSIREIEPIVAQIAAALEAVHKVGPHSNLKPENVIVLPDLLKLTDFGLGRAMPRLPFVQAMKSRRADRYLAPEFVAEGEVDARIDVYALGVILGEMLCGQTPDDSVPELTRINPEVPPAVEGIYRKAINQNPLARFQTPSELHGDLAELAARLVPPPLRTQSRPSMPATRTMPPPPPVAALHADHHRPALAKPPPPVPDLPSEPMHLESAELDTAFPDATQPLDRSLIPGALLPPAPPVEEARESTDVLDLAQLAPAARPPATQHGSNLRRATTWLVLLTLSGLGTGAAVGYWVLKRMRANPVVREAPAVPVPMPASGPLAPPAPVVAEPPTATPSAPGDTQATKAIEKEPSPAPDVAKVTPAKAVVPQAPVAPPQCPEDMRLIPGGSFRMGTAADDPDRGFDERGLGSVSVATYCIDVYEYPNVRGAVPTTSVGWNEASRLCESKQKRLCTEEEWEKACKGPSGQRFPYGNTFDPDRCNTEDDLGEDRALASAGKFPRCKSAYGVADLSGNVAEWTSTPYLNNQDKTIKGGAFNRPDYAARCSARKNGSPAMRSAEVGFRCCAIPN